MIASLQADLTAAAIVASTPSHDPQSTTTATISDLDPESAIRLEEALLQKGNLERELQLMASAWYDQNNRLMSNTANASMSRGRPPTEPKSFLGRQRRLVETIMTGKG